MAGELKQRIMLIQRFLKTEGRYSGKIDGIFGPMTKSALNSRFTKLDYSWKQEKLVTGIIQFLALEKGIDTGKLDGLWGPQTEFAFQSLLFLADHGTKPSNWRPDDAKTTVNPNNWPSQNPENELTKFYGSIGQNQVSFKSPYPMRLAWDLDTTVNKFSCHEKVSKSLETVLNGVLDLYGMDEIRKLGLDLFGGCLNVRKMRGGTRYSTHSWGIALDFDPSRNRLNWGKDRAEFAKPAYDKWWALWEAEGWVSLGRERNFDWMHVQAAVL